MAGLRIVKAVQPLVARRTFFNTARAMAGETGSGFSRSGGERSGWVDMACYSSTK
jgi:hypothetical protein